MKLASKILWKHETVIQSSVHYTQLAAVLITQHALNIGIIADKFCFAQNTTGREIMGLSVSIMWTVQLSLSHGLLTKPDCQCF